MTVTTDQESIAKRLGLPFAAEIDDSLVGKNFILKSDVTWDATGIIICGRTGRFVDPFH